MDFAIRTNARRAFTLIELLVVMAVIGILAALLFSALSAAQAKARRTTCLNNLRQINVGLRMYADDAADKSPNLGELTYITYKNVIKNYVGLNGPASARDKISACPSDTFCYEFHPTYVHFSSQGQHERAWSDYSSYGFNGMNLRHTPWGPLTRPGIGGMALSTVKTPAKTVLVAEGSATWPYSWHDPKRPLSPANAWFNDAKNMVSFVDGHVNYIKIYWDGGAASFYDPPDNYDYKWSGD